MVKIFQLYKRISLMSEELNLENILKVMLENDQTITYRAVAAQHPNFKYASSITRDPSRKMLVNIYQSKQNLIREKAENLKRVSQKSLIDKINNLEEENYILEQKNKALRMSHIALYKAVGELGGLAKWEKMFLLHQEYLRLIKEQNFID